MIEMTEQEREIALDVQAKLNAVFRDYLMERDGAARQTLWQCSDGWIVGYTTSRIEGGPFDGKFATMGFKPRGKGARKGQPENGWERVYYTKAATRKLAKKRAERLYHKHSR